MSTNDNTIDTTQFNDTPIIQRLKEKSSASTNESSLVQDAVSTRSLRQSEEESAKQSKIKPGRKSKYVTDEERLEARRAQQKAYRERKRLEYQQMIEQIKNQK